MSKKAWYCNDEIQIIQSLHLAEPARNMYDLVEEGVFRTIAEDEAHAKGLVAAGFEAGARSLAEAVCPNIDHVGQCRETITGKRCTFAANKHCAYVLDKFQSLSTPTDLAEYAKTIADKARFSLVDKLILDGIVSVGRGAELMDMCLLDFREYARTHAERKTDD